MTDNNQKQNRNRSQNNSNQGYGGFGEAAAFENNASSHQHHHQSRRGDGGDRRPAAAGASILPQCEQCGRQFVDENDLQFHLLTDHYVEPRVSECAPAFPEFRFDSGEARTTTELCGKWRGIQGENNSCYLDASLFGMFFCNKTFDRILDAKLADSRLDFLQKYLKFVIVNNLRTRGFVPCGVMVEWRRMLNEFYPHNNFNSHCIEQEACEFIDFLLKHFAGDAPNSAFVVRPLGAATGSFPPATSTTTAAAMKQNDAVFMYQLLAPRNLTSIVRTTSLLKESLQVEQLCISECQNSLILLLPRYGNTERVVQFVFPDREVSVDQERRFALSAVLCIGKSHFTAFSRVVRDGGERGDARWYYFDSMADRVDERNVPMVRDVTERLVVLERPFKDAMLALGAMDGYVANTGSSKLNNCDYLDRIMRDASVLLYRRTTVTTTTTTNAKLSIAAPQVADDVSQVTPPPLSDLPPPYRSAVMMESKATTGVTATSRTSTSGSSTSSSSSSRHNENITKSPPRHVGAMIDLNTLPTTITTITTTTTAAAKRSTNDTNIGSGVVPTANIDTVVAVAAGSDAAVTLSRNKMYSPRANTSNDVAQTSLYSHIASRTNTTAPSTTSPSLPPMTATTMAMPTTTIGSPRSVASSLTRDKAALVLSELPPNLPPYPSSIPNVPDLPPDPPTDLNDMAVDR